MSDLDARLAGLPRDVSPAHDLWPAIHASIAASESAQRMRRWRVPLALAAGLGIAVTAGLIGWQLARMQPETPVGGLATAGFAVPASAQYVSMRAALEHTYRERLELLAPATRRRIEQDLATIRAANADIRRALAADPESPVLNRLLESTWQQEFDLYTTVVRNSEPATQGNRT
ncbi:MAG TPA: hypothetical protein VGP20_11410 [Steroidobacteraceae bacterium]|jgi:hypothetical protein|nr:hypothetical protein [Steroidobacteraceae bacterium]